MERSAREAAHRKRVALGCRKETVRRKGYILVVETDDLIRALLERWLKDAGYTVVLRSSGATASDEPPCLVIANVSSPRAGGALIRSLQATCPAPILAVSARLRRGLGASAEAARQLGVRKVLPKPFTREELLAAVRESLESP